ncbi:hypothetical protein CN620_08865 [Bacillus pseudomycoides]|uniref:hypothetical protein n=1 Tax=Bacillus pseudomycoides TaxID=64104 RepID=UPI000BEF2B5A|nr:hypothetical protein [Bacillus pseudomycoides]PEI42556.1 hypothetical protein CN620_08865 [Bacillus pseudomycoides]
MKYKRMPTEEEYKLAEKNGISRKNVYQRVVTYDWDIEGAITKPLGGRGPGKHKGMAETAENNGIGKHVFYYRRRKGIPLYDAVTKPVRKFDKKNENFRALAKENGISLSTYTRRVNKGIEPYEAATKPTRKYVRQEKNTSWEEQYEFWKGIAKKNGIPGPVYYKRISLNWSFRKAATDPVMSKKESLRRAHEASSELSEKQVEIAKKNGISRELLRQRLKSPYWKLEEAMTKSPGKQGKKNIS